MKSRPRSRAVVRLGAGLALLIAFVAAGPRESGESAAETAQVTAIEIPVTVVGKDGKPVSGLTAADFELSDDGQKQAISRFEVVDLQRFRSAGRDAAAVEPAARRHWLITFDLSYASLTGLLRARDGAKTFVARAVAEGDLAAVSTLSVDTGWNLLVNFTGDRDQLWRAIDTLGVSGLAAQSLDPLSFAFEPPGRQGAAGDERVLEALKETRALAKSSTDDLARGRVNQLMESLAVMGRALDCVRGRKHVLYFSEGFETRLIVGHAGERPASPASGPQVFPYEEDAAAAASGEYWRVDSDSRFGSTSTRSIMTQALSEFRRADAALDTIDIGGLRSEPDLTWPTPPGSGTDALFAMASETGGDFVRNANRLGSELESLVESTRLVYLLVYKPQVLTKPGAFHSLQVTVKRPGVKVKARSGYTEPRPFTALTRMERVLGAGDLITGGIREPSFSAPVVAASFAEGSRAAQVPFIVEIPGGPLLAGDSGSEGRVQIFTYATDASGSLADYLTQEIALDLPRVRASLVAGGIKFYGTLFLAPGDFTIRTLVQNGSTGVAAVTATRLRVGVVPGDAPFVLPPFFRATSGRWMMIKAIPRPDAPGQAGDYPFAIQGESFIPAALPTLETGMAAQVLVLTYNFAAGGKLEPLQVHPRIEDAEGKPRPVDVQIVRRSDGERAGGRALVLSFKPDSLPAGRYVLRVRVSDRVSRRSSEASTDFEVRSTKG